MEQKVDQWGVSCTEGKCPEQASSGKYWNQKEHGVIIAGVVDWSCIIRIPSANPKVVGLAPFECFHLDYIMEEINCSYCISRTEVPYTRCDSHLVHYVIDDPHPIIMKYCAVLWIMTLNR